MSPSFSRWNDRWPLLPIPTVFFSPEKVSGSLLTASSILIRVGWPLASKSSALVRLELVIAFPGVLSTHSKLYCEGTGFNPLFVDSASDDVISGLHSSTAQRCRLRWTADLHGSGARHRRTQVGCIPFL